MNSSVVSDQLYQNAENIQPRTRFETGIGPMTDKVLNTVVDRLTSGDFKEKITDKIVDPITQVINQKIQPYIYVGIGLYVILVILLLIIIYLIAFRKNKIISG